MWRAAMTWVGDKDILPRVETPALTVLISSLPPPNRSHRWSRLLAAELQPQPTPFTAADEQIQPPVVACRCSPSPPVASPLLLTVLAAGLLVQEGVVMQEDKQMVVGTERGEQKLGKIFIKEELCKEHQVQKEQNQCRNAIHKENKIDQPSLFALPVAMVGRPGVFPYPGLRDFESGFLSDLALGFVRIGDVVRDFFVVILLRRRRRFEWGSTLWNVMRRKIRE
nr:protein TIME FOR COFFEE-like isoform X2 [Ipomoea batatas]